jgi:hypothetical protein
MEFKKYRRTNIAEMHRYNPNDMYHKEIMNRISISVTDKENGSPKNHNDLWLVAKDYFEQNFEEYEN